MASGRGRLHGAEALREQDSERQEKQKSETRFSFDQDNIAL